MSATERLAIDKIIAEKESAQGLDTVTAAE
jgi:hypothetical protein